MQKLTIIMLAFVAMIATACGSKYNKKTCEDLCEKINDGKKLTNDDYAECIKQCEAILKELQSHLEAIKAKAEDKDDKAIDLWDDFDTDNEEMFEHFRTMYNALEYADLKGENKTNFKELEKLDKEVDRLWERTRKKVNRLDD